MQGYQRQLLAAAVDCLVAAWGTGAQTGWAVCALVCCGVPVMLKILPRRMLHP